MPMLWPACSGGTLLMSPEACGLGTDLPGVDTVILHDSDWNPRYAGPLLLPCMMSAAA